MSTLTQAMTKRRTGHVTFDEFCFLVRDDQKADLIDGVIYMASPESLDANELMVWLLRLMGDLAEELDLGKIFGSRVALRLNNRNGPEPDVAFVRKTNLKRLRKAHIAGPADLVVEIVSPESVERDYVKKREQYQRFGVPEYWIIDEELQKVTLLRLGEDKIYYEIPPDNGVYRSAVLEGFWLRPEWLWQDPLPKVSKILRVLLKERKE